MVAFRNLVNFIIFLFMDYIIRLRKVETSSKTLLIIRLDSIGDYILFRNFLSVLKDDEKYKDYKFTLCGNSVLKNIAETLDSDVVDDFIWINRNKFLKNILYKYSILKNIYDRGYEVVINSTYTREILFGDQIVKTSNAKKRIGSMGSLDKQSKVGIFSNRFYTKLIHAADKNYFEFYRNVEFFEELLNKRLDLEKPKIYASTIEDEFNIEGKYAVIFPGAKDPDRRWSPNNFIEVAKKIIAKSNCKIVIPGGPGEESISKTITSGLNSQHVLDLTGKNTVAQLVKIISGAELLISNDSVAIHIAAAVGTKFICISSGIYWGRFHPYPKELFSESYFVYPDIVDENISNSHFIEKLRYTAPTNINNINAEKVCKLIDKIMIAS